MGEDITFPVNDETRALQEMMDRLRRFESPRCDPRVKAIMLTKLEEAWLWSLKLITPEAE